MFPTPPLLAELDVWKAIEQLPTRVTIKDLQGHFVYRNPAAATWALEHPYTAEYAATVQQSEIDALNGSPTIDRLEEEHWGDGSTSWARISRISVTDRMGTVVGVSTIATDVTDSKRIGDGYQVASEGAGDGLFWRNLTTGKMWFAPRWKEIIGYRDDEITNDREEWSKRVHPEDIERVERDIADHIEGRIPVYDCVYRMQNKDEKYLHVRAHGKVVSRDGQLFFAGSHTDITESKNIEKLFNHILETIPCLVWVKDSDLRFRHVNNEAASLLGKTTEALIGLTDADIDSNREHVRKFQRDDLQVLETGVRLEIDEEKLATVKGERILATRKVRVDSLLSKADTRPYVLGAAVDITDSRRAVLEAKSRLEDLLRWVPDGIFFKDASGKFLLVSNALADLAGVTPEELEGKTDAELFGEEFFSESLQEEGEIVTDKTPRLNILRRVQTKRYGVQMRLVNKVPILDPESGGVKYIIGISKDLTKLTQAYDLLDSIFGLNQLSFCIFIKDANLVYERCNPAFAKRHSMSVEKIVGRTDFDFWPRETAERFRADDRRVLEDNELLGPYLEEQILEGDVRTIETWKIPLRDAEGRPIKVLGIYQDVTERMEAKRNKDAEDLAIHVGHCFKDHSFLFQNKLQKLSEQFPVISGSHEFEATLRSARYLARMAEMIPQLPSFQNKTGSEVYPAWETVMEAIDYFDGSMIETRGSGEAALVRGSHKALLNAVLALLDNARRHLPAEQGQIVVKHELLDDHFILHVWDNGEGIREGRERVFEPFRSTKPMHTGIGLAWVRRVSEYHGGRARLADPGEDGVDSWSHFVMELPIHHGGVKL